MKATELRINNLVLLNSKETAIESIDSVGVNISWDSDGNYYDYKFGSQFDKLEEIPLTEEWLVKFGFEKLTEKSDIRRHTWSSAATLAKTDIWYVLPKNNLSLSNRGGEWTLNGWGFFMPIKYVHQLQNLYFALTGEELTIKEPALCQ